jgi:hypothetical protein
VCADESVFFVKSHRTGGLFFFCPFCGVAWNYPPTFPVLDEMDPLEHFAPEGIALPSREEINAASFGHLISAEFPLGEGNTRFLSEHLR